MILDRSEKRKAIVDAVAKKHGVSPRHMLGACKSEPTAKARWEAFALIKAATDDSYKEIGRFFNKNHSTVIYGIARYFGFTRPTPSKGLAGACDAATEGLDLFRDQLVLEARLIIADANAAKHAARLRNPLFAHLMGDRHAA